MKYDFRPYLNPVFIETGTANGKGVIAALAAGFPQIHSIELSPHYYEMCKDLFENHTDRVHIHYGSSTYVLGSLLKTIKEPCTFWLDAHWCGGKTAGHNGQIPLMGELKLIARHPIKTHTILIDDLRLIRAKEEKEWIDFSYTEQDLINKILSINPEYKISYEYGMEVNDILVARV